MLHSRPGGRATPGSETMPTHTQSTSCAMLKGQVSLPTRKSVSVIVARAGEPGWVLLQTFPCSKERWPAETGDHSQVS